MKNKILTAIAFISIGKVQATWASDEHPHKDESAQKSDQHSEHNEKEHEGNAEESSIVGPNKGIVAANPENGIKLSPEASKNFGLESMQLRGTGPWVLPNSAVVYLARETNLYRLRDGFYKRIDFKTLSKNPNGIYVSSSELKNGDAIVVQGLGLLRVAEIAAFDGAPEGHSH